MADEELNSITELGDPSKPTGEAGAQMLEQMNEHHYEVTSWALGFFNFKNTDTALDIGCGGGRTLSRIAETVTDGKIYGVDYSPVSVAKSTEYNKTAVESGRMEIIEASVENLPFADDTFDNAVTVESFYFWPQPLENLKEVRRVMKKGSSFMIAADIHGDADLSDDDICNIKKYNLFNPTLDEFRTLLENAGFEKVIIHTKENTSWVCAEGIK